MLQFSGDVAILSDSASALSMKRSDFRARMSTMSSRDENEIHRTGFLFRSFEFSPDSGYLICYDK
jgi:hypothetical protein